MKILYLDCCSGIAGDMLVAAMIDAGLPLEHLRERLGRLALDNVRIQASEVKRNGFRAIKFDVLHDEQHAHRHLKDITDIIEKSGLDTETQNTAINIFRRLAAAEAQVHGSTLEQVHFHEVGAIDSIVDIVGAAIGFRYFKMDRVICSPVPTGTGLISIAHGTVSVPAPATAQLLVGAPIRQSEVEFELTTPTGAAIAVTMASAFGPLPTMRLASMGVGAGSRELAEQANVMRLFLGSSDAMAAKPLPVDVVLLETNLDDVSPEFIGLCTEQLLEAGALDVYTTAIQMKKNRPAAKLTAICEPVEVERLEGIVFDQTGTLGIRRWPAQRSVAARQRANVATPWGSVAGIVSQLPTGEQRFAPEFEACRSLAQQCGVAARQVHEAALVAFHKQNGEPS